MNLWVSRLNSSRALFADNPVLYVSRSEHLKKTKTKGEDGSDSEADDNEPEAGDGGEIEEEAAKPKQEPKFDPEELKLVQALNVVAPVADLTMMSYDEMDVGD